MVRSPEDQDLVALQSHMVFTDCSLSLSGVWRGNLKELERKARLACSWLGSCSTWSALSKSTTARLCQMSIRTGYQLMICMGTS